jgi:hypothetical protein
MRPTIWHDDSKIKSSTTEAGRGAFDHGVKVQIDGGGGSPGTAAALGNLPTQMPRGPWARRRPGRATFAEHRPRPSATTPARDVPPRDAFLSSACSTGRSAIDLCYVGPKFMLPRGTRWPAPRGSWEAAQQALFQPAQRAIAGKSTVLRVSVRLFLLAGSGAAGDLAFIIFFVHSR